MKFVIGPLVLVIFIRSAQMVQYGSHAKERTLKNGIAHFVKHYDGPGDVVRRTIAEKGIMVEMIIN